MLDLKHSKTSNVIQFPHNTRFKDIVQRYKHELDENVVNFLNTNKWASKKYNTLAFPERYPLVRLWCQFGCIKDLYPVQKKIRVTKDDIIKNNKNNNYNNFKRWVEIPDDWLKIDLTSPWINLIEYNWICVEFLCLNKEKASKFDQTQIYL